MDEREGVEEATRLGLTVTATLGVLDRAVAKGWLDLPDVSAVCAQQTFGFHPPCSIGCWRLMLGGKAKRNRASSCIIATRFELDDQQLADGRPGLIAKAVRPGRLAQAGDALGGSV